LCNGFKINQTVKK
jgi:hypothetical protein